MGFDSPPGLQCWRGSGARGPSVTCGAVYGHSELCSFNGLGRRGSNALIGVQFLGRVPWRDGRAVRLRVANPVTLVQGRGFDSLCTHHGHEGDTVSRLAFNQVIEGAGPSVSAMNLEAS